AAAWPGRAGDPYADRMNAIGKYVVSSTLTEADLTWNTERISLAEVAELRGREGGDLVVWGSSKLVTSLLAEGLVDQRNLSVEPTLLGGGKGIFPADGAARPLELTNAVTAATGTLVLSYRPAA